MKEPIKYYRLQWSTIINESAMRILMRHVNYDFNIIANIFLIVVLKSGNLFSEMERREKVTYSATRLVINDEGVDCCNVCHTLTINGNMIS